MLRSERLLRTCASNRSAIAWATTILELLTSQSALVAAENSLVGLRFDYQLSRAELEAIAGREL